MKCKQAKKFAIKVSQRKEKNIASEKCVKTSEKKNIHVEAYCEEIFLKKLFDVPKKREKI